MDEAHCDVLVIGAGPAGSACASVLASAGLAVTLVDQHHFPRDKVCGDALIPDAIAALRRLGLLDRVMAEACRPAQVRCVAPSGRHADFDAALAVLPRRRLDALLLEEAIGRGARFLPGLRFVGTVEARQGEAGGAGEVQAGKAQASKAQASKAQASEAQAGEARASEARAREALVQGGYFQQGTHPVAIRAYYTVLATGASAAALHAAGMMTRRAASAMAARIYVQVEKAQDDHAGGALTGALQVVWRKDLSPGYGWIFPGPQGIFNLGVGTFQDHRRAGRERPNLRTMLDTFLAQNRGAQRLLEKGRVLGPLKGAPLRSTLGGARWWRPGLLVCGEAAGSTYDFTGEGIGKALETGMLAAQSLLAGLKDCAPAGAAFEKSAGRVGDRWHADDPGALYAHELAQLRARFALYERGNLINRKPWIAEVLVRLAQASPRLRAQMGLLLEERITPDALLSASGLVRLMWARDVA